MKQLVYNVAGNAISALVVGGAAHLIHAHLPLSGELDVKLHALGWLATAFGTYLAFQVIDFLNWKR